LFGTWKGYTILCPDFNEEKDETFVFQGSAATMKSKRGEFLIKRCDPKKHVPNYCITDTVENNN